MRTILLAATVDQSLGLMKGHPTHLAQRGWQVHVVSSGDSGRPPESFLGSLPSTVEVHHLATVRDPSPVRDVVSFWRWIRLLGRVCPDVVLIGTPKASLLGLTAARIKGVPRRIYLIRGFRFEGASGPARRIYIWLERWVAAMATEVVAVSPSLKELADSSRVGRSAGVRVLGPGSSNGVVVPSSQQLQKLRSHGRRLLREAGLDLDVPTIGYVGRLTKDKGVHVLAAACASLRRRHIDHQLLLMGEEEDRGYLSMVTSVLDGAALRYTRLHHAEDPASIMAALDVFCLPSFREGMPNVALEAAALEVAVVASDATGCRDSILPGETGELVRTGDAAHLERVLGELILDQDRRLALGAAGARWVAMSFERSRVWARWDHYLDEGEASSACVGSDATDRSPAYLRLVRRLKNQELTVEK